MNIWLLRTSPRMFTENSPVDTMTSDGFELGYEATTFFSSISLRARKVIPFVWILPRKPALIVPSPSTRREMVSCWVARRYDSAYTSPGVTGYSGVDMASMARTCDSGTVTERLVLWVGELEALAAWPLSVDCEVVDVVDVVPVEVEPRGSVNCPQAETATASATMRMRNFFITCSPFRS